MNISGNRVLQVAHITKEYPGVKALDDVSLEFHEGEVHALVGENGAGKSTLIKIIAGAIEPDGGTIHVGGQTLNAMTVGLAKKNGIQVIYQEFVNVRSMNAAENVFLGEQTSKGVFVNAKERQLMAKRLFDQLGVDINPQQLVGTMSPAYQQVVEIAKAVSKNARIIIMDEPTAPLTVSEVEMLFKIIKDLKSQGVTIIYISHRLEELFEIADRVSVMRDGKFVATRAIREVEKHDIIAMMVGREMAETYPSRNRSAGEELLRVENFCGNGDRDISFTLHRGEILGFAGLVGAGRTELMELIYGARPLESGGMYINGKKVSITSPGGAIKAGIGMVPEDRKELGLFLNQSIQWNTVINCLKKISSFSFVNSKTEAVISEDYHKKFNIKTPQLKQYVRNLSGGNQQKVALAKTMAADSDVIIFDEPTRGIDVSAKQEIYALMNQLAESGKGVLMVSSDMPELMGMSDRIVVIAEGRQTGIINKEEFDQKYILTLASMSAISQSREGVTAK
ncbi:ribose ABC transporter ATP-binding protein [Spirochaetia bacterium]|nr:ribose ABC transporter ATP-binding protein [Spirochaetia bacterium]